MPIAADRTIGRYINKSHVHTHGVDSIQSQDGEECNDHFVHSKRFFNVFILRTTIFNISGILKCNCCFERTEQVANNYYATPTRLDDFACARKLTTAAMLMYTARNGTKHKTRQINTETIDYKSIMSF